MEKLVLKAEIRGENEKNNELRASKIIPWVVYGHSQENKKIKFNNSDLLRTYRVAWENHIVSLELEGKKIDVLFHDVQLDPVTDLFLHIDLLAITAWEKVTTHIPLVFVWNSKAKAEWAIIEESIKELEVKCLPTDLIDNFEVDLSLLEKEWDIIRVSNLNIDSKYEVLTNKDDVIAAATKAKVSETTEEASTEEETK